ncbi:MAG: hypothetical protein M1834_001154 [Cirrosporium novae-zelandiae]|nr:MAG: hypothetical protein M1834_001154 [Cirrosporium novae-zelandiae]
MSTSTDSHSANHNIGISVPFQNWSHDRLFNAVQDFIQESGLNDHTDYLLRGAFLAQDPHAFDHDRRRDDGLGVRDEERVWLDLEYSEKKIDKFKQPWLLYLLVGCCSLGATVQGWDETAVNGAQVFYEETFNSGRAVDLSPAILSLINGAPYLLCAFSCWLNYPLNYYWGRRGTIFFTCIVSSVSCLGQAFTPSWQALFAVRLVLGLGIGPKSATIPIYAAECAPSQVRGALVMMWQMWTAFGIMCGCISGVIFGTVIKSHDLAWRLILGSPMILPIVVVLYVFTLPESPRWLLLKAHDGDKTKYSKAFDSLCQLRNSKLQAARDLFLMNHLLKVEKEIWNESHRFRELFTIRRNRRALIASLITMFFQQFCGVNVLAYYSTYVLTNNAHWRRNQALVASMGFGIINFLFALPAVWTIDSFGRRNLLLTTFPFMALFQALVAISFVFEKGSTTQTALLLVGMYLFSVAYSPGEGPVPFVYSAESMPLYNRDLGMGLVTSVTWLFNFTLAISFLPFQASSAGPTGAFGFYAGWNIVGWFAILLSVNNSIAPFPYYLKPNFPTPLSSFVPETKGLTLEELDDVFKISTWKYATYGRKQAEWFIRRYLFGQLIPKPKLPIPTESIREEEYNMETSWPQPPHSKDDA